MKPLSKKSSLFTGFAMFAMFFGAGNIVFPLNLGLMAQDKNLFALFGLLITAVVVPLMGVIAMAFYRGDVLGFFERMGKTPGFLLALFILSLLGPCGGLPRCIALSYATFKQFFPSAHLWMFSLFSCGLIFLLTYRKSRLISLLGSFLTPFLLISMSIIIIKGLMEAPTIPHASQDRELALFVTGLKEGYNTLDLLPAFFFSSIILSCLRKNHPEHFEGDQNARPLLNSMLKASAISGLLLAIIYVGLSFLAAHYSASLSHISQDLLLSTIAVHVLGPYAGAIVCAAVLLSCLTTAIALAAVFSDFVHEEVFKGKWSYKGLLGLTLGISFFFSTLEFSGIVRLLAPILEVCYPGLIVMTVLNLMAKLFYIEVGKKWVPVTFIGTMILQWL